MPCSYEGIGDNTTKIDVRISTIYKYGKLLQWLVSIQELCCRLRCSGLRLICYDSEAAYTKRNLNTQFLCFRNQAKNYNRHLAFGKEKEKEFDKCDPDDEQV